MAYYNYMPVVGMEVAVDIAVVEIVVVVAEIVVAVAEIVVVVAEIVVAVNIVGLNSLQYYDYLLLVSDIHSHS